MMTSNSTEANKALVLAGIKGVFIDRDPSAVDRLFKHWGVMQEEFPAAQSANGNSMFIETQA